MLNKVLSGMLLLILVTSPSIAVAQDLPSGKWWHNPRMSKELNLSEAEKSRLDQEFVNSRRKLIELKSSVERERFELENLLEKEALNEAAVMEQFKKLEKARASLSSERFSFLIKARKILGLERFQRIKMFYGKLRHQKMRHNMGNARAPKKRPSESE
jgi:Spy/CpxP family protein refolding chaperone